MLHNKHAMIVTSVLHFIATSSIFIKNVAKASPPSARINTDANCGGRRDRFSGGLNAGISELLSV